jgi:hypothetical protein
MSTRGVLGVILGLLGLLCMTPLAFAPHEGERPAHWPMWVLMTLYQPLCGVLWPIIESYLSGGRSGPELRSALGRWNITWCSAVVAALWGAGPLIEHHAPAVMAGMGLSHWVSGLLLGPLGAEPGVHVEMSMSRTRRCNARLLVVFRVLLPLGYMCPPR